MPFQRGCANFTRTYLFTRTLHTHFSCAFAFTLRFYVSLFLLDFELQATKPYTKKAYTKRRTQRCCYAVAKCNQTLNIKHANKIRKMHNTFGMTQLATDYQKNRQRLCATIRKNLSRLCNSGFRLYGFTYAVPAF